MRDFWGVDRTRAFQLNRLSGPLIEQANTPTEQHRHNVKTEFVKQSRLQTLMRDVGAIQRHNLVASSGLGLPDGALHAIGDKSALERPNSFGSLMRHDKNRHMQRMLTIPAVRVVVGSSAAHNRPD